MNKKEKMFHTSAIIILSMLITVFMISLAFLTLSVVAAVAIVYGAYAYSVGDYSLVASESFGAPQGAAVLCIGIYVPSMMGSMVRGFSKWCQAGWAGIDE